MTAFAFLLAAGQASAQEGRFIRLHTGAFDPLVATPQALVDPGALTAGGTAGQGDAIYIVQFDRSPSPADQAAVTALGAKIHTTIEDDALIVRAAAGARAALERLSGVRWVGPFLADYRLEQGLLDILTQDAPTAQSIVPQHCTIMLFERDQAAKDAVVGEIRNRGGAVHLVGAGRLIEATMSAETLREVAGMNEVLFVERWTEAEDDMDLVRELNGANLMELLEGYTGQGVRGEVFDDGVRAGHRDFQANPPLFHPSNSSDNDHGTNTYGIVFGDGTANARGRGLLPDAEQPIFSTNNRSFDRFRHTAELVDPAGPYRAVFQSNSWGNSRTRNYTAISADMDDIIFNHDILITQSQSNAGNRDSRPQAWAKNIVSVGGIRHFDTATRNDDRWNGSASIGPASDGRIKPDLSHFYDNIFTTNETGNSAYSQFGGTSGATPAVAGHFGLLFEMWADGVFAGGPGLARDVFDSRPHASTAKALMINGAFQYAFSGTGHDRTRVHQGWGFPDLQNLYEAAEANGWGLPILIDETEILEPGGTHSFALQSSGAEPLKVTMVYLDPPGVPNSSVHRVNDLTLKVTSPSGATYWGNNGLNTGNWSASGGAPNTVDTVENVFVEVPEAGTWTIEVRGDEIVQDSHLETPGIDADYALVAIGGTTGSSNLPVVSIGTSVATAREAGPVSGEFTVTRTGDTAAALDVSYTVSGSATAGSDYTALSGSVTIPAGAASATVAVDPIDDTEVESDETVALALASDAAYQVGAPGSASVTIQSDDVAQNLPVVTVRAVRDTAAEAGLKRGRIRIDRTGDTSAALTVRYSVAGSATEGSDYRALAGEKTIKAGKSRAFFDIVPLNDNEVEDPETVDIAIAANAAYQTGSPANARVTVTSDDGGSGGPVVTITVLRDTASEAGLRRGRLKIVRTGGTGRGLTVRYGVGGSATEGSDYRALAGEKRIKAGKRRAFFDIIPLDDGLVEPDETVRINLRDDPAYSVGTPGSGTVTVTSDDQSLSLSSGGN